ncbi:MAG: type IX secretion system outer membrane channel protein PorV [Bacteroidales bacterium]|nr:type IX secretion system outer membrane channel protein PorV [Bacteroidales bacterium]
MKKYSILSLLVLLTCTSVFAQDSETSRDFGTITTAVPFLMIGPDARAGGMGDIGVATSPDGNAIYWNASKLAFVENDMGYNVSYVPWLKGLVDDIGLGYVSFYKQMGGDQTIGASLRYFSLGNITFTNEEGTSMGVYKPNEWAIDLAYARKLSDNFSAAITGKFIYSNLTLGQSTGAGVATNAGTSVAADVSMYYRNIVEIGRNDVRITAGMSINNMGNKISYTSNTQKDFIPTNMRIGLGGEMELDAYNTLSLTFELTKLLVPTPPVVDDDGNPISPYRENDVSVFTGMLQSFYDAPFSEEMQEINIAGGVEYWYDKQFALRGGYFYESEAKGNRQYFTLGAGLKYNVFGLDFSYLISTNPNNPLKNTLRFTLSYEL